MTPKSEPTADTEANRKSLSITLPEPLHAQLTGEAKSRMLHASLLVENALEQYLPTLPPLPGTAAPELDLDGAAAPDA